MKKTHLHTITAEGLGQRIEQLIQEHLEECRRVAQDVVMRSLHQISQPVVQHRATGRSEKKLVSSIPTLGRRTPDEICVLSGRLYGAVCDNPGETMVTLAARLGLTAVALQRPMALLKNQGDIRSVGQRNFTRYFPTGKEVRQSA